MLKEFSRVDLEGLKKVAQEVLEVVNTKLEISEKACIIFLTGDLGSGKTTFTKELAKLLKIEEDIVSPTFVLRKDYSKFIHIDGYRLESAEEGKVLELDRELNKPGQILVIEWPERFAEAINLEPDISLNFKVLNEKEREILINIY